MKYISSIYQALVNRKEKIIPKSEIIEIIKEYNKRFKHSLSIVDAVKYLARQHHIKRIFQSYYYINSLDERKGGYCNYEDKELLFIVLGKLKVKWYIGLNSALYLAGKQWQVPSILQIVNNKFTGEKKIVSLRVRFFKLKDKMFFALEQGKTTRNNIGYLYSNAAKSHLDMAYLRKTNKLIRNKNTKKYIKYYPKWLSKK